MGEKLVPIREWNMHFPGVRYGASSEDLAIIRVLCPKCGANLRDCGKEKISHLPDKLLVVCMSHMCDYVGARCV